MHVAGRQNGRLYGHGTLVVNPDGGGEGRKGKGEGRKLERMVRVRLFVSHYQFLIVLTPTTTTATSLCLHSCASCLSLTERPRMKEERILLLRVRVAEQSYMECKSIGMPFWNGLKR